MHRSLIISLAALTLAAANPKHSFLPKPQPGDVLILAPGETPDHLITAAPAAPITTAHADAAPEATTTNAALHALSTYAPNADKHDQPTTISNLDDAMSKLFHAEPTTPPPPPTTLLTSTIVWTDSAGRPTNTAALIETPDTSKECLEHGKCHGVYPGFEYEHWDWCKHRGGHLFGLFCKDPGEHGE